MQLAEITWTTTPKDSNESVAWRVRNRRASICAGHKFSARLTACTRRLKLPSRDFTWRRCTFKILSKILSNHFPQSFTVILRASIIIIVPFSSRSSILLITGLNGPRRKRERQREREREWEQQNEVLYEISSYLTGGLSYISWSEITRCRNWCARWQKFAALWGPIRKLRLRSRHHLWDSMVLHG